MLHLNQTYFTNSFCFIGQSSLLVSGGFDLKAQHKERPLWRRKGYCSYFQIWYMKGLELFCYPYIIFPCVFSILDYYPYTICKLQHNSYPVSILIYSSAYFIIFSSIFLSFYFYCFFYSYISHITFHSTSMPHAKQTRTTSMKLD